MLVLNLIWRTALSKQHQAARIGVTSLAGRPISPQQNGFLSPHNKYTEREILQPDEPVYQSSNNTVGHDCNAGHHSPLETARISGLHRPVDASFLRR